VARGTFKKKGVNMRKAIWSLVLALAFALSTATLFASLIVQNYTPGGAVHWEGQWHPWCGDHAGSGDDFGQIRLTTTVSYDGNLVYTSVDSDSFQGQGITYYAGNYFTSVTDTDPYFVQVTADLWCNGYYQGDGSGGQNQGWSYPQ
jgi:hypothetical protein